MLLRHRKKFDASSLQNSISERYVAEKSLCSEGQKTLTILWGDADFINVKIGTRTHKHTHIPLCFKYN